VDRSIVMARAAAIFAAVAAISLTASLTAAAVSAGADHHHDLVAIEFRDWPPSELGVSGGFLGVPDSSGRFPASFQRYDKGSGQNAPRGVGAGNLLVFTDLQPGTYRVALFLLEETKMFRKLLHSKMPTTEDRCLVYGDTAAALTFTVRDGDVSYLGCVVRKMRAAVDSTDVWGSSNEWNAGNEAKAWRSLAKRKEFAGWRDLLDRRTAVLVPPRKRKG
jgi:hypothetical protein